MNQDLVNFDGSNFTHCHDKMKFLLIALKVFHMLDQTCNHFLKKCKEDGLHVRAHFEYSTGSGLSLWSFTPLKTPRNIYRMLWRGQVQNGENKYRQIYLSKVLFDFKMVDNVSFCINYKILLISSVIYQFKFLGRFKWDQSLQYFHQVGTIIGKKICMWQKITLWKSLINIFESKKKVE